MTMSFDELPEFLKEFKHYIKKYKSLSADLLEFQKILLVRPLGNGKHFNVITIFDNVKIVKARLFCRYLKGASNLRVIYAYCEDSQKIEFIEIYFKGEKENEDKERIKNYLKNL
ncbi:MAG: hypothetical protein V1686_00240 [Patescibacteria group bacterium]